MRGSMRGAAFLAAFSLGAAGFGPAEAVELRGAGATFPAPLYAAWIDAYREVAPDVAVTYDAVGSGEGIRRFLEGELEFGASDAAMTDEQIAQARAGAQLVPATAGILVLAYNIPGVPSGLNLPRDVLADIFLGRIRNWSDPRIVEANPDLDLPNLTIAQVVRRDSSGTTFAMTNHLSAISEDWGKDYGAATLIDWPGISMSAYGNEGVAGRIALSWGSIGYVEQGFAERLGLPVATLENAAGNFVSPSAAAGQAALDAAVADMPDNLRQFLPDPPGADAYPIVTYSWLLLHETYESAEVAQALHEFVRWGLTDGQAMASDLGYIPLPESVAERGLQRVALAN